MEEHAAAVPNNLRHGGDLVVPGLGLHQARVHSLQDEMKASK